MKELYKDTMIKILGIPEKFANKDKTVIDDAKDIKAALDKEIVGMSSILDTYMQLDIELEKDLEDVKLKKMFFDIIKIITPDYEDMYKIMDEIRTIRITKDRALQKEFVEKMIEYDMDSPFHEEAIRYKIWEAVMQLTITLMDHDLTKKVADKIAEL